MINLKNFISEQILFSKTFATSDNKEISLYITNQSIYSVEHNLKENRCSNYIFNRSSISTMILFETTVLSGSYCIQLNIDGKPHTFNLPRTPDGEAAADEIFAALVKY